MANVALQLTGYQNRPLAAVLFASAVVAWSYWIISHERVIQWCASVKTMSLILFILSGALIGGAVGSLIWYWEIKPVAPEISPKQSDITRNRGIFVDCEWGAMPSAYPLSGELYVLEIQDTAGNAIGKFMGAPNGRVKWNNTNFPEWAYKCEVTNYTGDVVFNVVVPMELVFSEAVPVPESPDPSNPSWRRGIEKFRRSFTVNIPKLDNGPNSPYVFYIWNCCIQKTFIQILLPSKVAQVRDHGEASIARTVPIIEAIQYLEHLIPPRNDKKSG